MWMPCEMGKKLLLGEEYCGVIWMVGSPLSNAEDAAIDLLPDISSGKVALGEKSQTEADS